MVRFATVNLQTKLGLSFPSTGEVAARSVFRPPPPCTKAFLQYTKTGVDPRQDVNFYLPWGTGAIANPALLIVLTCATKKNYSILRELRTENVDESVVYFPEIRSYFRALLVFRAMSVHRLIFS